MIPQDFEYSVPSTLDEALAALALDGTKALSGGMSLIPLMKLRLATPARVIDLRRVPGLNAIQDDGTALKIGAMVTHYQIESSPLVRSKCPLLAEVASAIGDVQVRNLGTIGGSVAHADPAADYPAALHALGAQITLARKGSRRTLAADQFFVDTFTTALEPGEIVVELTVPVEKSAGVAYEKVPQAASGFALIGVAARVEKTAGKVSMARVGVTGLSGSSFRATAVEKLLEGTPGSADDIRRAVAVIADGVDANADIHASADYRKHLARVHGARALAAAAAKSK